MDQLKGYEPNNNLKNNQVFESNINISSINNTVVTSDKWKIAKAQLEEMKAKTVSIRSNSYNHSIHKQSISSINNKVVTGDKWKIAKAQLEEMKAKTVNIRSNSYNYSTRKQSISSINNTVITGDKWKIAKTQLEEMKAKTVNIRSNSHNHSIHKQLDEVRNNTLNYNKSTLQNSSNLILDYSKSNDLSVKSYAINDVNMSKLTNSTIINSTITKHDFHHSVELYSSYNVESPLHQENSNSSIYNKPDNISPCLLNSTISRNLSDITSEISNTLEKSIEFSPDTNHNSIPTIEYNLDNIPTLSNSNMQRSNSTYYNIIKVPDKLKINSDKLSHRSIDRYNSMLINPLNIIIKIPKKTMNKLHHIFNFLSIFNCKKEKIPTIKYNLKNIPSINRIFSNKSTY